MAGETPKLRWWVHRHRALAPAHLNSAAQERDFSLSIHGRHFVHWHVLKSKIAPSSCSHLVKPGERLKAAPRKPTPDIGQHKTRVSIIQGVQTPWDGHLGQCSCAVEAVHGLKWEVRVGLPDVAEVREGLPALCQPPICSCWGNPLLCIFGWLWVCPATLTAQQGRSVDLGTDMRGLH